MSSAFEKYLTEDRRLVILMILAQSAGYACNEHLLRQVLSSQAHNVSKDRLRSDLAWLKEQDLITVEDIGGTLVAKAGDRGVDVSKGLVIVPGVKRPDAGG